MVGRAVVRRLEAQGFTNLVGIDDGPKFDDCTSVDWFFAKTRPQYVVAAAGRTAGIVGNQKCPADLMLDNLLVATHLIPSAWRYGTEKLLYLASSCAYPKFAEQPLAVKSLWTGPVEPTSGAYAVAKLAGIRLCEAYRQQHGAHFITAISADVFGPGDDFSATNSHVVGGLLRRMHEARLSDAETVEIWGTGSPRREFLYVDDLADAAIFLVRHYEGVEPINIGTGVTTTIRELAEILRHVVGYTGELRFDTGRPDGTQLKGLDSTPLRHLGWTPAWSLRAALERTYESFLAHPETWEETPISYGG